MSDLNAHFHLSLARITTIQILRSTGIDRAKPSVIEGLTDLLARYLVLVAQRSKECAESAGRSRCEMEDLREALERLGAIAKTGREGVREEEGVVDFISWCMSDENALLRKVAGEGKDEMGDEVTSDWLSHMLQRQIKVSGEDRFKDTVLGSMARIVDAEDLTMPAVVNTNKLTNGITKPAEDLRDLGDIVQLPAVVQDHIAMS